MLKKRTFLIMNISVLSLILCLTVIFLFSISTPKFIDKNFQESTVSVINYSTNDQKMDKAVLMGQFRIGKSILELPNPKGRNIYTISVSGGKVILSHRAYNPDGHTWSVPPGNNQLQYITVTGETPNKYDISINENHGKLDKVYVTNPSLWDSVNIEYSVKKS